MHHAPIFLGQNGTTWKLIDFYSLNFVLNCRRNVACVCFSAINGSGPAYLSELLHVYTQSRTLRSSSDTRMLKIQQYKCKTHGFCTFSCFGPHIWNSLPQDLRHCSILSFFKAKLKNLPLLFLPQLIPIPSFCYSHCVCVRACACVRACVFVCVCVCVCFHIIPDVNCFDRSSTCVQNIVFRLICIVWALRALMRAW